MIDDIRKRISLATILFKPEGFPEEINIGEATVQTFDETRYDDIDLDWSATLLDGEIRLKDASKQLEWIRSARPFHLFTAVSGASDLLSTSAAVLDGEFTIVCPERHVEAIETAAIEAGSAALRPLTGFDGLPAGWAVLEGYKPVRALDDPPEWLPARDSTTIHGWQSRPDPSSD